MYPAYLVSIALALPVVAAYGSLAWDKSAPAMRAEALAAQLLAVQAWIPREEIYLGINSPAWSISVEAFFYALFPLLIGSLWRSFATAAARSVFVMAALTWACAAAVFAIPHHADVWTTYIFPPVRLVDFVVGMLLGIAFLRGYRLPGSPTAWELAAVGAVASAILAIPHVPAGLQYSLLALPCWAALIAIVALRRGAISRLLSHRAFVRLGEISYAFYLVHLSVLIVAEHVLAPAFVSAVALAVSLAAAWLLHAGVERPLRTFIRGRADAEDRRSRVGTRSSASQTDAMRASFVHVGRVVAALFVLSLSLGARAGADPAGERAASAYLDGIRSTPLALRRFMQELPKGARPAQPRVGRGLRGTADRLGCERRAVRRHDVHVREVPDRLSAARERPNGRERDQANRFSRPPDRRSSRCGSSSRARSRDTTTFSTPSGSSRWRRGRTGRRSSPTRCGKRPRTTSTISS